MIRIQDINKKFKKLQVLKNVSATFNKGDVIALIGPNGSGKTTLIKSMLGLVKPDSGSIFFKDTVIATDFSYRQHIGYMPQIGRYPDNMKIGQLFRMLKDIRGVKDEDVDKDLVIRFSLPDIFDKSMRTLSGGTRQKVSAALAFLFNPDVLILDEPTAGLDPISSEILKAKIIAEKEKGKLILVSSHILSDLDDLITHVMYMQDGEMQFFKDIQTLQRETGESRLGKAVAYIMKGGKLNLLSQSFISHQGVMNVKV
jgi:Cu-processing system ATP-binding protein